jgi:hypothetical protein
MLEKARFSLKNNENTIFYENIFDVFEKHFSEKSGLFGGNFSLENLRKKFGETEHFPKIEKIWKICEQARYGGIFEENAMPEVLADVEFLVKNF